MKHTQVVFLKYSVVLKKRSYKLLTGVNILFIIIWIRIQENKTMHKMSPKVRHTAISRQTCLANIMLDLVSHLRLTTLWPAVDISGLLHSVNES